MFCVNVYACIVYVGTLDRKENFDYNAVRKRNIRIKNVFMMEFLNPKCDESKATVFDGKEIHFMKNDKHIKQ